MAISMRHGLPPVMRCSAPTKTLRLRRCVSLVVRAEQVTQKTTQEAKSDTTAPSISASAVVSPPAAASQQGNVGLTAGAVAAAVLLFAATRLGGSTMPTLTTLEQLSTPLDVALVNGRPTLVEFYANWCEVCRDLVPDEYELGKQYQGKVNFVMLNIDNSQWAPEVAEFGVQGVPHFIFIDRTGEALAAAVGRVPRQVLEGNLEAMVNDAAVPFAAARGRTSSPVSQPGAMAGPRQAMPRDHA